MCRQLSKGQFSGGGGNCPKGVVDQGAVDWVAIILVGNCPRWELSGGGGQLSGGSCLGAIDLTP